MASAIGAERLRSPGDADAEEGSPESIREELVDYIRRCFRNQVGLFVFENADSVLSSPVDRDTLDSLLSHRIFDTGATIIVSRGGECPSGMGKRLAMPPIQVKPFTDVNVAMQVVATVIRDGGPEVRSAIEALAQEKLILVPGVLRRGASLYLRQRHAGVESDLALALIDATEPVLREVLTSIGLSESLQCEKIDGTAILLGMGILASIPLTEKELSARNLPIPPFEALIEEGWLIRSGEQCQWDTTVGIRAIRALARKILLDANAMAMLTRVCEAILEAVRSTTSSSEDQPSCASQRVGKGIEEAIAWLRSSGVTDTPLEQMLLTHLVTLDADALLPAVTAVESQQILERLQARADPAWLETECAGLVISARSRFSRTEIKRRLAHTIERIRDVAEITPSALRWLDAAAYLAGGSHPDPEMLSLRLRLVPFLLQLTGRQRQQHVAFSKWIVSWLLNTAGVASQLGEGSTANSVLASGLVALSEMPKPKTLHESIDHLWLHLRGRLEQARIADTVRERVAHLREAVAGAATALEAAAGAARWVRIYLRACTWLIKELDDDQARQDVVNAASWRLQEVCGAPSEWSISVRVQMAALMRDQAVASDDVQVSLAAIDGALGLLKCELSELKRMASLGDSWGLLVLARVLKVGAGLCLRVGESSARRSKLEEAQRVVDFCIDHSPTGKVWLLALQLYDGDSDPEEEPVLLDGEFLGRAVKIHPKLRRLMRHATKWLSAQARRGELDPDAGTVRLWCVRRQWRDQGSIEHSCVVDVGDLHGWHALSPQERVELLTNCYKRRRRQLDVAERIWGPSLALYLERAFLECNFQRVLAFQTRGDVDSGKVEAIYAEAIHRWPQAPEIRAEWARYYRYIWRYGESIAEYERLLGGMSAGFWRRRAILRYAEVLFTAASFHRSVESDGQLLTESQLLQRAATLLEQLRGFLRFEDERVSLAELVDFKLGKPIDWKKHDAVLRDAVGDIGQYPSTVAANAKVLLSHARTGAPQSLPEALLRQCTSVVLLRATGRLYMLRAEQETGDAAVESASKAYRLFDACRLNEMAVLSTETVTTSFLRGKSILLACERAASPRPFLIQTDSEASPLSLAIGRFDSASKRSAGGFRGIVEWYRLRAQYLRMQLQEGVPSGAGTHALRGKALSIWLRGWVSNKGSLLPSELLEEALQLVDSLVLSGQATAAAAALPALLVLTERSGFDEFRIRADRLLGSLLTDANVGLRRSIALDCKADIERGLWPRRDVALLRLDRNGLMAEIEATEIEAAELAATELAATQFASKSE